MMRIIFKLPFHGKHAAQVMLTFIALIVAVAQCSTRADIRKMIKKQKEMCDYSNDAFALIQKKPTTIEEYVDLYVEIRDLYHKAWYIALDLAGSIGNPAIARKYETKTSQFEKLVLEYQSKINTKKEELEAVNLRKAEVKYERLKRKEFEVLQQSEETDLKKRISDIHAFRNVITEKLSSISPSKDMHFSALLTLQKDCSKCLMELNRKQALGPKHGNIPNVDITLPKEVENFGVIGAGVIALHRKDYLHNNVSVNRGDQGIILDPKPNEHGKILVRWPSKGKRVFGLIPIADLRVVSPQPQSNIPKDQRQRPSRSRSGNGAGQSGCAVPVPSRRRFGCKDADVEANSEINYTCVGTPYTIEVGEKGVIVNPIIDARNRVQVRWETSHGGKYITTFVYYTSLNLLGA